MNIPDEAREQIKRVYNRAYEEAFVTSGGGQHVLIEAGVLAVAAWARKEALREAAEVVDAIERGYAVRGIHAVTKADAIAAIHALAEEGA